MLLQIPRPLSLSQRIVLADVPVFLLSLLELLLCCSQSAMNKQVKGTVIRLICGYKEGLATRSPSGEWNLRGMHSELIPLLSILLFHILFQLPLTDLHSHEGSQEANQMNFVEVSLLGYREGWRRVKSGLRGTEKVFHTQLLGLTSLTLYTTVLKLDARYAVWKGEKSQC